MSEKKIHINGHTCIIDACCYENIIRYQWRISKYKNGSIYALTGKNPSIGMHRIIMSCPDGFDVDHINGNGLDNRTSNLRIVTRQLNAINSRLSSKNTSGYRGITFDRKTKKWRARAQLRIDGERKIISFGYYPTKELAFAAYKHGLEGFFGKDFISSSCWS